MKFVLATRNIHKKDELEEVLSPLNANVLCSLDFPHLQEVEEDGASLEENALKKARYTFETTGFASLADDTGLFVPALNGAPGVYSARYAGENATYTDNVHKLLRELKSVPHRNAYFRTVIALVDSSGEHLFCGEVSGTILKESRGKKGFGYDPVFMPQGFEISFAEMEPHQKNAISHRGRAVEQFITYLKEQAL